MRLNHEGGGLTCLLAGFCHTLYNILGMGEKGGGKGLGGMGWGGVKNNKTCFELHTGN